MIYNGGKDKNEREEFMTKTCGERLSIILTISHQKFSPQALLARSYPCRCCKSNYFEFSATNQNTHNKQANDNNSKSKKYSIKSTTFLI